MKSIRSYLLVRLLGGSAVVLAAAGFGVYFAVTRALEAQFDDSLTDRARGFGSIMFQIEDEVDFAFSEELMPEYGVTERPAYFELWYDDGEILERSQSLRLDEHLSAPGEPSEVPMHWSALLPDGRKGRFVAQIAEVHHMYPEEGPNRPTPRRILMIIGKGTEDLMAAQNAVFLQCAMASLALMGLIAFISWWAVTRGLAPAVRFAGALDELQVDRLPDHIEVDGLPEELTPVAEKTDALIRRVGAALERERRTTADIAHELRTPIAEILTVSEVALRSRDTEDVEDPRKALAVVRDVASRMGRSVSTLLKLAWLEMGAEKFESASVKIGDVVREIHRSLAAVERERDLTVENRIDASEEIDGDGDVVRIVVSNLLNNAFHYTTEHGIVECRIDREDDLWSLIVENDTQDLEQRDLKVLSEPFWRKDKARADRNRFGLGLALSRTLARKAGMNLEFDLQDGTFRATLRKEPAPVVAANGRPT